MAQSNKAKFRLYHDRFNKEDVSDMEMLASAFLTEADTLSPVITHLAGREDKRFPLSVLTEGMGKVKYTTGIEYDYPVIGRLDKAVKALSLSAGNGQNYTVFEVIFEDNWFVKNYVIEAPNGLFQARLTSEGVRKGGGWAYTMQLVTTDPSATVTAGDIEGKLFTQMFAPNAFGGSRGNESKSVAPSKMRNQKSLIRKSYGFEGNMPNAKTIFEFNIGGQTTQYWYPFEEWQRMLQWKEECESFYWYSEYNRDENGEIHLFDENGKSIPIGAGVLDQIPNKDSYGKLTANKIKQVVRDALFGASDAQEMNVVLFTGTGGAEEFDNAMKDELANAGWVKNTPESMAVSGGTRSMTFGGFFTQYEHIDGHSITIKKVPLFDHGKRALNSDKHPRTGLPLESYRMVFLDMSTYDGEPNVQMISTAERALVRRVVAGMTAPPGYEGNTSVATDIDGASVHFLKEAGINIRRATNCLHLECNLAA